LSDQEKLILKQIPLTSKQKASIQPMKFKFPITSTNPLTSETHRPLLVDYIFETVDNHLCSKGAAFMAVQLLDRCIEKAGYYAFVIKGGSIKPSINQSTCQMTALACAVIAMKMENSDLEFETADLMWDEEACAKKFKVNLFQTEHEILNCLEWKLQTPNCCTWLSIVTEKKEILKAEALCQALVKDEKSMEFLASYLVAAVLCYLGQFESMFGYTEKQLENGMVLVAKTAKLLTL
jgi:hypothetical protein